jgi:hypothetical protein
MVVWRRIMTACFHDRDIRSSSTQCAYFADWLQRAYREQHNLFAYHTSSPLCISWTIMHAATLQVLETEIAICAYGGSSAN